MLNLKEKIATAIKESKPTISEVKAPKAVKNKPATLKAVQEVCTRANEIFPDAASLPVSVSNHNGKLGKVGNLSLPPIATCSNCGSCSKYCYAVRSFTKQGMNTDSSARKNAWLKNLAIMNTDIEKYFLDIAVSIANNRFEFFRWHVSGDITSVDYLSGMIEIANYFRTTQFLCFTKNYDVVNEYLEEHEIPANLHMMFSAAPDVHMPNPHGLPECHVAFEDSTKDTFTGCKGNIYHCSGNCEECIGNECGCFYLKNGDVTIINQH